MAAFESLTPQCLLDAVETCGLRCDGRLLQLNSYENRVYQIWLEDDSSVVGKFYRPGRWTEAAILEEHAFSVELAAREIPVVAPLPLNDSTLHEHGGFRFALYPRRPGRTPELEDFDTLTWLGRFLGRIHAIGALRNFAARPAIDVEEFGRAPVRDIESGGFIPDDLRVAYRSVVDDLLTRIERCFRNAGRVATLRLHGDCHAGNILWTPEGPHFVDLDDARNGPAVQDLWMLLSGDRQAMTLQLDAILEGYRQFYDFNPAELQLIEALRSLRVIHYAGWLARRWDDPTFKINFPWFNTQRYWQDHILSLREQAAALDEPPLQVY